MFVGSHERQLDDKGRLALPPAYRSLLGESCYLVGGDDRCVKVYPAAEFRQMADDMMARTRDDRAERHRQRALASSASHVTFDKQGRVTIDDTLRGYARLTPGSRVVVSGNFECAEVWAVDAFERFAALGRGELAGGQD